jgi:hypothetical protein
MWFRSCSYVLMWLRYGLGTVVMFGYDLGTVVMFWYDLGTILGTVVIYVLICHRSYVSIHQCWNSLLLYLSILWLCLDTLIFLCTHTHTHGFCILTDTCVSFLYLHSSLRYELLIIIFLLKYHGYLLVEFWGFCWYPQDLRIIFFWRASHGRIISGLPFVPGDLTQGFSFFARILFGHA